MRAIVQRVKSASVVSDKKIVGEIKKGYFVLLGVKKGDTQEDAKYLSEKISKLRIMPDEDLKTNKSLTESDGQILVVSQFSLYANTLDGNRPSFFDAEEPKNAQKLYNLFVNNLKESNFMVETGSFGKYMNIDAKLDGPLTIIYDTNEKK